MGKDRDGSVNGKKKKVFNENFELKRIEPKTENQDRAFFSFFQGQHLFLHGIAGTGKTFIALYLALTDLFRGLTPKVVIVRSAVPTRDMGFLPGTLQEKLAQYELPYKAMFTELFGRGDAYDLLKRKGVVEFISTSTLRGTTLRNCIVIVDEAQNCNFHELDTVITRSGENCRLIFCGDYQQTDLTKKYDVSGITDFMRVIQRIKVFDFVQFQIRDIVRSDLVREYIIQKTNLNIGSE